MRIAQELDSTNAVPVNVVAATASVEGLQADKSAFVEGTALFTPAGGVLNDTISTDPTEDQAAAFRITAKRGLHTNLRSNAGVELASATTTPAGTELALLTRNIPSGTQAVSGTVTANAGSGPFPVSDNAGSLTVDAPVGTPVAARLSDGSAFYDGAKTGQLPSALVSGRLDVTIGASPATVPVTAGKPATADIVVGQLSHTATTGASTLLTIAAGKTWQGTVTVCASGSKAAAATGNGEVMGEIATAGTNVTPAAGNILVVRAKVGANAATGATGTQGNSTATIPVVVNAPVGNSVTLTLATTLTSVTTGAVDATASGVYVN